ncbi:putative transposase [Streptomyces sp. W007]|nr:putative transposase [Streptomyces sp. W007]
MMNARRHARDYERLIQHSETLITWAAITFVASPAEDPAPTAGRSGPDPT